MIDITIHLKNGKKLEFRINTTLGKLYISLNKLKFIRLGTVIINTSEIVYIEEGE